MVQGWLTYQEEGHQGEKKFRGEGCLGLDSPRMGDLLGG